MGGVFVCVRLGRDVVFEAENFVCQSKHQFNMIAFEGELKLFERVLHGAFTNQADGLELKLSLRRLPNAPPPPAGAEAGAANTTANTANTITRPFLTFTSKGSNLNMVQELPISKPLASTEVDALISVIRSESVCPYYVDLIPVVEKLNNAVTTLKKISETIQVSLVRNGDAHFKAFRLQQYNTVGVEFRNLEVIPETQRMTDEDISQQRYIAPSPHRVFLFLRGIVILICFSFSFSLSLSLSLLLFLVLVPPRAGLRRPWRRSSSPV